MHLKRGVIKKNINILLADDDSDDRLLFREAISSKTSSVSITEVLTGQAAWDILISDQTDIDLVVLDINMPELNGMECLKLIRSDHRFDNIPVIVMSTSNDYRAISEARKVGANYYAIKPGSFKVLQQMLAFLITIDWSNHQTDPENFLLNVLVV